MNKAFELPSGFAWILLVFLGSSLGSLALFAENVKDTLNARLTEHERTERSNSEGFKERLALDLRGLDTRVSCVETALRRKE